jgi:hypothetical protein
MRQDKVGRSCVVPPKLGMCRGASFIASAAKIPTQTSNRKNTLDANMNL